MYETGIPLDYKHSKLIAPKGIKKVHGPSSGNKSQITILDCSNAVGIVLPPMVIFKAKHLHYEWTKGEIPNTIYRMSPQGWIDHEVCAEWFLKLFTKYSTNLTSVIAFG